MTRTYLVVFEKGREAWGAYAPDVPGTGGMGDTLDEARQSLREGIGYVLDHTLETSTAFPEGRTTSVDLAELEPNPAESHYEVEWMTIELPTSVADTHAHGQQAA